MLKCVVIDSDFKSVEIVESYCRRQGNLSVLNLFPSDENIARVKLMLPEIVFMDVSPDDEYALEAARQISAESCLIIMSASSSCALEAYELGAVDFLHKPFSYDRFDKAVQKAMKYLKMLDLLRVSEANKLVIKSEYKKVTVPFEAVLYVESEDNYVKVHLMDGSTVVSKTTLATFEAQLPKDRFVRVHRSFIIARRRVIDYNRNEISLSASVSRVPKSIPVGRNYADSLSKII